MNHLFWNKKFFFLVLILIVNASCFAQQGSSKWSIGLGGSILDFYPTNEKDTGNPGGLFNGITKSYNYWNFGIPRLQITRRIKRNFSLNFSLTMNEITKVGIYEIEGRSYYAVDGEIQYILVKNGQNLEPFLYGGGGYTWVNWHGTGTVNIGAGSNIWIANRLGLNFQAGYKHSNDSYEQLKSHFIYTFSLVMKFKEGNLVKWNDRF